MTEVDSVPAVTEDIKPDNGKLFVDDKKSRSDIECFVHEEYFNRYHPKPVLYADIL